MPYPEQVTSYTGAVIDQNIVNQLKTQPAADFLRFEELPDGGYAMQAKLPEWGSSGGTSFRIRANMNYFMRGLMRSCMDKQGNLDARKADTLVNTLDEALNSGADLPNDFLKLCDVPKQHQEDFQAFLEGGKPLLNSRINGALPKFSEQLDSMRVYQYSLEQYKNSNDPEETRLLWESYPDFSNTLQSYQDMINADPEKEERIMFPMDCLSYAAINGYLIQLANEYRTTHDLPPIENTEQFELKFPGQADQPQDHVYRAFAEHGYYTFSVDIDGQSKVLSLETTAPPTGKLLFRPGDSTTGVGIYPNTEAIEQYHTGRNLVTIPNRAGYDKLKKPKRSDFESVLTLHRDEEYEAELKHQRQLEKARQLENANIDPIFSREQIANYDKLFKQNAGSSSPEYQKLEAAYRAAAAFDADDELRAPGTGDQLRYMLYEAAADYYNAKLPQEQNATRRSRMALARDIFRATAPDVERGEQPAAPADEGLLAEQPGYEPLTAEQTLLSMTGAAQLSAEDRRKPYAELIDELGREARRLARLDGKMLVGKGNALLKISMEADTIKEKVNAGEIDDFLLTDIINHANAIPHMANPKYNSQAKENVMSAEEKALVARVQQLKRPEEMDGVELGVRFERNARRSAVESYRDRLREMQQRMKSTDSRFFNRDSEEYKAMAAEVGSMLEFLNGSMLGRQDPKSVIDLDSPAFRFRLGKLQNAAADYFEAKLVQDKNANRQTRLDVAEDLMKLPDLNGYRQELDAERGRQRELGAESDMRFDLGAFDLRDEDGVERFLTQKSGVTDLYDRHYGKDLQITGDPVDAAAVQGGRMVYDILRREREAQKILEDPEGHTRTEQALARRDVLVGKGVRDYMAKNWKEPATRGLVNQNVHLINPKNIEKLKNSLLQKAAGVTELEKKLHEEGVFINASARTLQVAPMMNTDDRLRETLRSSGDPGPLPRDTSAEAAAPVNKSAPPPLRHDPEDLPAPNRAETGTFENKPAESEASKRERHAKVAANHLEDLFRDKPVDRERASSFISTTQSILSEPGMDRACDMMASCSEQTARRFMSLHAKGEDLLRGSYQTMQGMEAGRNGGREVSSAQRTTDVAERNVGNDKKVKQGGGLSKG